MQNNFLEKLRLKGLTVDQEGRAVIEDGGTYTVTRMVVTFMENPTFLATHEISVFYQDKKGKEKLKTFFINSKFK